MTPRDRRIKEKLLEDLMRYLPILIDDERRRGRSESSIKVMVDEILDRINELKSELRNDKK